MGGLSKLWERNWQRIDGGGRVNGLSRLCWSSDYIEKMIPCPQFSKDVGIFVGGVFGLGVGSGGCDSECGVCQRIGVNWLS